MEDYLNKAKSTKNATNYALNWVKQGLNDWCISRNLSWGVKFPKRDDLVVYVWIDAPIGYVSFTRGYTEDWEYYWKGNGNIIHFIGPDIIYHHCIFWPAMLKAAGYNLPYAVVASGAVKVEGKAFSKTRGYAVWLEKDYLDNKFDPDALRYYITSFTGQTKDLDFSWSIFHEKVNNELVAILGNFVYRTLHFAYKNFQKIPDFMQDDKIKQKIIETVKAYWGAFDKYEFKEAIDSVIALAKFGNEYFQRNEPWVLIREDSKKCQNVLGNALWLTKALAILIEPFMPKKSQSIWQDLSQQDEVRNVTLDHVLTLNSGTKLQKPQILFEKIEKDVIDSIESEFFERIQKINEESEGEDMKIIEYADFEKINMVVGEIIEADAIKGADKLLKMKVNIGDQEKQVVAGLAQYYKMEELVGKKVILLENLKPAKLRGVESQGMILAAEAGEKVVLLTVDSDMENGAKVL